MIITIESGTICGIQCIPVKVEVDVSKGLPCFDMVGYLGSEVKEARERVRVAIKNIGIDLPPMRITVNLSPAHVYKAGTVFDLPIAVGILAALGYIPEEYVRGILMVGEIALSGEIRGVRGILPIVQNSLERGITHCIIPKANEREGAVVGQVKVIGAGNLEEILNYLQLPPEERDEYIPPARITAEDYFSEKAMTNIPDYGEISGQESAKRGIEVAAAGFHNIMMIGPPGAGKTMIAQRIPGILPPLDLKESLEVSAIYSVAGLLKENEALITHRPFLNPHHTISEPALIGGGRIPRPGVISLAHHAVLFLDEFGEFKRKTLDILRQPIEEKKIHIARTYGNYTYPADFMLVAAMNPCPCGYYPDKKKCRCSENEISRYLSRISGPILDRIDISVEVAPVKLQQLNCPVKAENSASIRARVMKAIERQEDRFRGTEYKFNSQISGKDIQRFCPLGKTEEKLINNAFNKMGLSARAYHRVLKVARTIADLDGSEDIKEVHLTEAICYRLQEGGKT